MLWLLTYIDDSSKLHGLEQLWYKDWKPRTEAVNSGFEDHERYIVMKLIKRIIFVRHFLKSNVPFFTGLRLGVTSVHMYTSWHWCEIPTLKLLRYVEYTSKLTLRKSWLVPNNVRSPIGSDKNQLQPQGRIQEGGRTRRAPPLKLEKNMTFWRKIVIFHTKYPKHFHASLRSALLL